METFNDKVAIVTGGGSGIGKALCMELGSKGSVVVVADINAEHAHETANTISQGGGQAYAQHVNVADEQQITRLVHDVAAEYQHLDYMFNHAGINLLSDARDLRFEHWRRVIDINLWGLSMALQRLTRSW